MSDSKHVVCPFCNAVNRIPNNKMSQGPACGKCHKAIFTGKAVKLSSDNFRKFISKNELPVVVDFWAPWCGPCKMMAPAFEQTAAALSTRATLAKLNTEDEPNIGGQYNIRSIPTMVIFKNGKEIARQSGAMSANDIQSWVSGYVNI